MVWELEKSSDLTISNRIFNKINVYFSSELLLSVRAQSILKAIGRNNAVRHPQGATREE